MAIYQKKTLRVVSIIMVVLLLLCTVTPFASAKGSAYIECYLTSMTAGSNGVVTAAFQITGTGTMDEIGATTVTIYENGSIVKTFSYTNTSGMMGYNKVIHGSTVSYNGTVGKSYSAFVVFKAGKNGDWDNRSMSTSSVTAKN